MSKKRQIFFQLLCAVLIGASTYFAWTETSKKLTVSTDSEQPKQSITANYEEKAFEIQSKFVIGLLHFFDELKKQAPEQKAVLESSSVEILTGFEQVLQKNAERSDLPSSSFRIKELILASYFNLESPSAILCETLLESEIANPRIASVWEKIKRICSAETPNNYTSEELEFLASELGWFGELFAYTFASEEALKNKYASVVLPAAKTTAVKTLIGIIIGTIVFTTSLGFFLYFAVRLARGKIKVQFSSTGMPSAYSLEIFTLYMLGMFLMPRAMSVLMQNNIKIDILTANIIGISSMLVLIIWPCFFGNSLSSIRERMGLKIGGFGRLVRDIALGPISYITMILPFFVILIFYSLALEFLKVDPAAGAHPIVPVITAAKNPNVIYLIAFMAVVVAPIIEEIMFRGAFYSWLRERCGPVSSILLSSIIFAAVHPQGAIGLLPLSCIGIMLATLRELRGNLVSCIVAHGCVNAGTLSMVILFFR